MHRALARAVAATALQVAQRGVCHATRACHEKRTTTSAATAATTTTTTASARMTRSNSRRRKPSNSDSNSNNNSSNNGASSPRRARSTAATARPLPVTPNVTSAAATTTTTTKHNTAAAAAAPPVAPPSAWRMDEAEELGRAAEVHETSADETTTTTTTTTAAHAHGTTAASVDEDTNTAITTTRATVSDTAAAHADGINDDDDDDSSNNDTRSDGGGTATTTAPAVGSLLDYESSLNLRLATLTRQPGKAFRAIAAYVPLTRERVNFVLTFEDMASGARLSCTVDEVRTRYFAWIAQFRAAYIALFVPTLHSANTTVLLHVLSDARAAAPRQRQQQQQQQSHDDGDGNDDKDNDGGDADDDNAATTTTTTANARDGEDVYEDADHLVFSYTKLREVIAHKRRDVMLNPQLLTVAVLNALPEEWRNFITAPQSCYPQAFLLAAFNFHAQESGTSLNKELLHAQLATAADALLHSRASQCSNSGGKSRALSLRNSNSSGSSGSSSVVVTSSSSGSSSSSSASWSLIFVSTPTRRAAGASAAVPPMQDLLTGQFVEPLTLSGKRVVYIIGTGNAAESFAHFPVQRKGTMAYSILLQDIEAQLGLQRPHRVSLTAMLAQALDTFSRRTWMSLMEAETGAQRVPRALDRVVRRQRRSVQREIVPSFLEAVFAPCNRLLGHATAPDASSSSAAVAAGGSGGAAAQQQHAVGAAAAVPATSSSNTAAAAAQRANRRLEDYIHVIYNNTARLAREQALRDDLRSCHVLFVDVTTAGVTAARRADNPFSLRNGLTSVSAQLWPPASTSTTSAAAATPALHHVSATTRAGGGDDGAFVDADAALPADLPTDAARARHVVLVAWDAKRVLLFLRNSRRLREFLLHGGRVWCAQYAQYLLKGFNHMNLATMERTLLQYHDGPVRGQLHALSKLKLIYDTQVDVAVTTRQLSSIVHRMDGLLASAEMEVNGLQLVSQAQVTRFADQLHVEHGRLERVLQEKIMDFTRQMDDDVRQRINFRSPQDISTIIYGGALCRHLGSRFVPTRPARYPVTALLPHAMCVATGTPVPSLYTSPETLLGGFAAHSGSHGAFGRADVTRALQRIAQYTRRVTLEQLVAQTAVVVVVCRAKMGGLLEQVSIYCPAAAAAAAATTPSAVTAAANGSSGGGGGSGDESNGSGSVAELTVRVAIDDILPVTDTPDLVTVTELKAMIARYKPLTQLLASSSSSSSRRAASRKGGKAAGAGARNLRNVLILTQCSHDKLEPLVDTGVLAAIERAVLGDMDDDDDDKDNNNNNKKNDNNKGSDRHRMRPLERVCFADLSKAFPPPPQGADTFESDFTELSTANTIAFSAKAHWDVHTRELLSLGGLEGVMKALFSHCASMLGGPRDALRSTHPVPSCCPHGLHGQEQASTPGMLWMVTPPSLHPLLRRFLKGRAASSGADAMERVTVFLAPYKDIDLSFFTALQQLRFTEKKMQLFDEGCLFRAVLPECHDRVHGELCHCVTATGRLSSQSPNLQNIPKEEDLRRLIVSRFGDDGRMIEADYSQLEVVVLAALSRDPRMMQELRDAVDFHCLRVSLMTKEPYEAVVHKAKVLRDPHYLQLRQQAKVFSFQRQYGAGVSTIATTTGLTEQEVDKLIAAEEQHYRELSRYYRLVTGCVDAGADRLLRLRTLDTPTMRPHMRRVVMLTEPLYYFVVPTGSKFDFVKDRKSVPRLKNYPVQGLAGEIVQIMCGKVLRCFYAKRNYGNKAFLVNTVHDCVWVDAHVSVAEEVKADIARIMGSTHEVIGQLWPDMRLDVPFKAEVHMGRSLGELAS